MKATIILFLLTGIVIASDAADPKSPMPPLTRQEQTILELTNEERAREKIGPLVINAVLTRVARAHSANMLRQGEMKHELDGKRPAQRVDEAGYDYKRVAENIAWTDGVSLKEVMKNWMESKGHRENILNPGFDEIGVGIAKNDKGEMYFTQVFGKQRVLPKKPDPNDKRLQPSGKG